MSKQKLFAYTLIGIVGLGVMYLLATSSASPSNLDAFKTPSTQPDTCTSEPIIAGLPDSPNEQVRQLAFYQQLCDSGVTKTLVATEDTDINQLRNAASAYGLDVRTADDLRADTAVQWQEVSTHHSTPLDAREDVLQLATDKATNIIQNGGQAGIYLNASGDNGYFGTAEPLLKDYITRWYQLGIRLALGDTTEYAEKHEH